MASIEPTLKLYCDKKNTVHTDKNIKIIQFKSCANITAVENPTIVVNTKTAAYGIFDGNNKLVPQSLQYRGKHHNFIPPRVPQNVPYIDAEAIYIGNTYPHFGHFLLEHLNRLWGAVEKSRKLKYIFINNRGINVKNFVYDFMATFGVKKQDVIILTTPTRFKKVYIPSQTFNMSGACIDYAMVNGYRAMAENVRGAGYERVYMSRTKLPENIKTIGEEKLEKIFIKNGYKVIYPETMTIAEQIAAVADAKYLAGCSGTALHWALCMKPGGTVIALKRNSKPDDFIRTQYMLNTVTGLNSVFITASTEKYMSSHGGTGTPQIVGVNEHVKKFLDDFGFKYTNSDIAFDQKAMNTYLERYKAYKAEHGGKLYRNICSKLIKLVVCLVPGRISRRNARQWLKTKLHC